METEQQTIARLQREKQILLTALKAAAENGINDDPEVWKQIADAIALGQENPSNNTGGSNDAA